MPAGTRFLAVPAASLVVPLLGCGLVLWGLASGAWTTRAPNRLLPGVPVSAAEALGWSRAALAIAAVGACALLSRPGRAAAAFALAASSLGLLTALAATGLSASTALHGAGPAARVMLGSGAWTALTGFAVLAAASAGALGRGGGTALASTVLGVAALAGTGFLDGLSLVVEARGRGGELGRALVQHLALTLGSLALAAAIACPLAVAASASRKIDAVSRTVLGLVQVIPAIALFGLLVPGLALLLAAFPGLRTAGLGAIGATPAVLGVGVYLALPLASALTAGLRGTDPAVVEAATALGYGRARLLREIRWPLARPAVLGGVRLAVVQSIGLVTLGGLIGAGGFGAVVFQGMAQFAPDLILLGSLPVVALALSADVSLARLSRQASPA